MHMFKQIRLHHRPTKQHTAAHRYLTTDLQRHWFTQCLKIHTCLYISARVHLSSLPTHISLSLIPEARESLPGEEVNVTELPLHHHHCWRCRFMLFHRNAQKYKSKQCEFCSSSFIQSIHGSFSCLWAIASFQLADSFRQAASRQLPFFFKAPQAEQIRGPAQLRG